MCQTEEGVRPPIVIFGPSLWYNQKAIWLCETAENLRLYYLNDFTGLRGEDLLHIITVENVCSLINSGTPLRRFLSAIVMRTFKL